MKGESRPGIRAVLVDDEPHCTETLRWMLDEHCPQVAVQAVFHDPREALRHLREEPVDVLFLDIEMPSMNAFELLRALDERNFQVVFTTAYDEFAIQAIRSHALDYLMKPIDRDELLAAVTAVEEGLRRQDDPARVQAFLDQLAGARRTDRLAVPTRTGVELVPLDQLVYAGAEDNYTRLHLSGGRKLLLSRTLGDVERELPPDRFCRVHLSYVVALDKVERYVRGTGGHLVLQGGVQVPVARARKDEVLQRLGIR